jgi:glycosyltransferase involved in cell wall biosynthesis
MTFSSIICYPKVTVVTVVRNAEKTIERTIESILNQDYPNLEYIVIDGNSQDETRSIIQKYRHHIDHYVSEPDQGIYDAMNKASCLASGTWILYMNAGDRFNSHALKQLVTALNSDADAIFAGVSEILVDDLETRIFHKMPRPIEEIWRQMPTSHQATIVRSIVQQNYPFDIRYQWCADHDMIARMYRDGKKFLNQNTILSIFDCSSDGTHRDLQLYIRERWQLSKGLVSFRRRLIHYGGECLQYMIWGKIVTFIKMLMPKSIILYLRRLRKTTGQSSLLLIDKN